MQQETALGILRTGRNVYLTGAAGAGKTHVLNQYIQYLRSHNVGIGVTASTGIAATHLGGMTIHSWSGIGIKDYLSDWDIDALSQRKALIRRFDNTDVLIIDEVSMLRPEILDMVDQVARALKRVAEPFGGMQVVLSGDFFQLPPVVRDSSEDAFVDSSQAWHEGDFRVCYLDEQHRQEGGALLKILNDIRDGSISEESREALRSRMQIEKDVDDVEAVVLHTHNKNVDARNIEELEKINEDSVVYEMSTSGRANVVESLKKSVLAPESLELKVGARVMFVKNSQEQDYVNGTLGEVISLDGEYPTIRTHAGKEIVAHPVSWETTDDGKVVASVTQVPLRLAWAITVHKSQGMSLDAVEIDLSQAFTPGQGYVALSRARTLDGLVLKGLNEQALQVHPYVSARDVQLQENSTHWNTVFTGFDDTKVQQMQQEFITRVGRESAVAAQVIPTHMQTAALLEQGSTIAEIASEREITKATVLSHLEKLRKLGKQRLFAHLEPDPEILEVIAEAFEKTGDAKLAPVHKILDGQVTYEEMRLARLFLDV